MAMRLDDDMSKGGMGHGGDGDVGGGGDLGDVGAKEPLEVPQPPGMEDGALAHEDDNLAGMSDAGREAADMAPAPKGSASGSTDGGAVEGAADEGSAAVSRVDGALEGAGDADLNSGSDAASTGGNPSASGGGGHVGSGASGSDWGGGTSSSAWGSPTGGSAMGSGSSHQTVASGSGGGGGDSSPYGGPPDDSMAASVARGVGTNAAANAAGGTAHTMGAAMLAKGAIGMASSAISAVGTAAGGVLTGIGTFVTGLVGLPAAAATTVGSVVVSAVSAVAVAVVVGVGSVVSIPTDTGTVVDCATTVAQAAAGGESAAVTDVEAIQLEYAKKIYAFLHYMGLSDEAIAGVIGSWICESGIDPTSIETIYDDSEKYRVDGPKKAKALEDISAFTVNVVLPAYAGKSIHVPTYMGETGGRPAPGMGLGQWTGDGAWRMMDFAKECGYDWYDFDFQLAYSYMASPARGVGWFENVYKPAKLSSVSEWCHLFNEGFEGNVDNWTYVKKPGTCQEWFEKIKTFSTDDAYAQTIKGLVEKMGASATTEATHEAVSSTHCAEKSCVNVTSIATAAVELSQPYQELSKTTPLDTYSKVIEYIFPGTNPKDCGHGAATAVRWSGADDEFPVGCTWDQVDYMEASPRWEKVVSHVGSSNIDKLEPGDVVICAKGENSDGHVVIYTGHEAIEAKWGDKANPASDFCHASLNSRHMACSDWGLGVYLDGDSRTFDAYRCVDPMNSKTYAAAGSLPGATTACSKDDEVPTEATTAEGEAIVNEAVNGIHTANAGWCAQWVSETISAAIGFYPSGNACDMYYRYCTSSNKSDLKPGMIIAVPAHPHTTAGSTYGHVGIYIGNNTVRHNIGGVSNMNLDDWIAYYGATNTPKWGWAVA